MCWPSRGAGTGSTTGVSFRRAGGVRRGVKRPAARREVRARDGFSVNIVNEQLDFLVVGSIPNPQWKFGDFGNKIKKAQELSRQRGKPRLISEPAFMTALAAVAPTDSGEIDTKIMVLNYTFLLNDKTEKSIPTFEAFLQQIHEEKDCHVRVTTDPAGLFTGDDKDPYATRVQCRFVKHFAIDDDTKKFAEMIMGIS